MNDGVPEREKLPAISGSASAFSPEFRLKLLSEISRILVASLEYEKTLALAVRVAVPQFADWCIVNLVDDTGKIERFAAAHADPAREKVLLEMLKRYPIDPAGKYPVAIVVRTEQTLFFPRVTDAVLDAAAEDSQHRAMLEEVGTRSGMGVPLVARGRLIGSISFVLGISGREYASSDVELAEEIGHRVALAIDNARLFTELGESEERFRATFEQAAVGLAHVSLDGAWLRVNQKLADIVGYTLEELRQLKFQDITYPDDITPDWNQAQRLLQGEISSYSMEKRYVRKDGSIVWVNLTGSLVRDKATGPPKYFIAVVEDINERKLAERAVIGAEKLAATGRLAATLAHEINNPLGSILNLLYLAKTEPELSESVKQYLTLAEVELNRTGTIVKNMLGFHREAQHPVAVDVCELAASVTALYQPVAKRNGIRLETQYEDCCHVNGYPGELRQVISNLLSNALEAVGQRGTVVVRVAPLIAPDAGRCLVLVADNGRGIPADVRRKLGSPFFTTKGEKGTGLGLWVSKGIVLRHQGRLRILSKSAAPNSGTCMAISLPISHPSAAVKPDVA